MIGFLRSKLKKSVFYSIHVWDERKYGKRRSVAHELSSVCWDMSVNSESHLVIQGCDAVNLANRYKTPLHVVDKKRLEKNYLDFYSSFAKRYPRVEISYSYKTNPIPRVLEVLHGLGAGAEVISEFELWLALKLGVAPEKIIYNGPAKTRESIALAVSKNVKIINIDNLEEIEMIDALARRCGVHQQVGVRVVTSVGWASQFGFSIENGRAFEAFERLKKKENLVVCGIHLHLGTGIRDVTRYLQAIKEVLEFSRVLRERLDIYIEYFDFGGGFGVPTVKPYSMIDTKLMENNYPPRVMRVNEREGIGQYSSTIIDLLYKYFPKNEERIPTLVFEPGRAVTSSAQSLLLEVLAIKRGKHGVDTVILNGGKNVTMPMGYEYHEIFAASKMNKPACGYYNLFGPLCHPHDILFKYKKLPELEVGDILAIMDAGAYFVPNQMNFSNPRPGVIIVESGRDELIREHETFEDIIARDVVIEARAV